MITPLFLVLFGLLVVWQLARVAVLLWCGPRMRARHGFEDFDLLENVRAVEALRGDGEGRRRTEGFMVGSGASPADAESC